MTPTPTQSILQLLEETLPPCFPRKKVHELTFGLVNPRTLANKDSEGNGPLCRFLVKREVWYQKREFLEYLRTVITDVQPTP